MDLKIGEVREEVPIYNTVEDILKVFSKIKVGLLDLGILKKFYINKEGSLCYCLPILYQDMKRQANIKYDSFYNKMEKLRRARLITKIPRCNPSLYQPREELRPMIVKAIILTLAKFGLASL